jgi:hypothetical protein
MCSGPVSGERHERRSVEEGDEVAEAAAQRAHRFVPRQPRDLGLRGQLARRAPPDEHRLQAVVGGERVAHAGPALGHPVLLGLARRDDDRRGGPVEAGEEVSLPRALGRPRAEVPRHGLVRNA